MSTYYIRVGSPSDWIQVPQAAGTCHRHLCLQALHLCSVYDPSLRKRVFPYVKKNGALKAFVGVSVVTAAVTIGTSQFKLCHSRCVCT
jgi:hypothetical protein